MMKKQDEINNVYNEDYKMWVNTSNKSGKVVLIQPFLWEAREKNKTKFTESLALGYLAGALQEAKFSYIAINSEMNRWDAEDTVAEILRHDDVFLVGISCKSERAYREAKEIAAMLKKHKTNVHITLGGLLATVADQRVLNDSTAFDSVCRGEGEYLITELAYKLLYRHPLNEIKSLTYRVGEEIIRNSTRKRINDLDLVTLPFRNEINEIQETKQKQMASAYMVASRGCFATCTFCSIHQLYGDTTIMRRSPQNILNEMKDIYSKYGISRFSFVDDQFVSPSKNGIKWLEEFCDLMEKEGLEFKFYAELRADTIKRDIIDKLVKNGLHRLFIGIESGSDNLLKRWRKGCSVMQNKKALIELENSGIKKFQVNFGYIMFDPLMSYDELKENYYWVKNSGFCKVQHLQNKMNIYYGTPAYDIMVKEYNMTPPEFGDRWKYEFYDKEVGFVESILRTIHLKLQNEILEPFTSALVKYKDIIAFGEDIEDVEDDGSDIVKALNGIYRYINALERDIYFNIFESCFNFIEYKYERTEADFIKDIVETSYKKAESLNQIALLFINILDDFAKEDLAVTQSGKLIKIIDKEKNCFDVFIDIPIYDRYDCEVTLYLNSQ